MSNSKMKPDQAGRRFRGKWLLLAGITVLAAVAAGSLAVWRQQRAPAPRRVEAPKPAPVAVVGNEVSLSGKVQAQKVVMVPAPIEGMIESFAVEVGQEVFEGQLLGRITNSRSDTALEIAMAEQEKAQSRVQALDATIIATRLEASRARADATRSRSEFERAEKAYQRQKMLFAEGATPRLTYEKAEREYTSLREESESKEAIARAAEDRITALGRDMDLFKKTLDEKNQHLDDTRAEIAAGEVHAPVEGVVIARHGQPGEEVTRAIENLFSIATALSAMEITVEPTPPQLQRIKAGQPAAIHIAEMPNEPIPGTVREIQGTRVIVDFTSPTPLIKPGLTAQVTIKLT